MASSSNVPLRTPMYDAAGNLTRTWALFFQALASSTSALSATSVTLEPSGGIATPDLSGGATQFVLLLTSDVTLALPVNPPAAPTDWTLIVQQDPIGGHSLLTPDYPLDYAIADAQAPATTESIQRFTTDASGTRAASAPVRNQSIPA